MLQGSWGELIVALWVILALLTLLMLATLAYNEATSEEVDHPPTSAVERCASAMRKGGVSSFIPAQVLKLENANFTGPYNEGRPYDPLQIVSCEEFLFLSLGPSFNLSPHDHRTLWVYLEGYSIGANATQPPSYPNFWSSKTEYSIGSHARHNDKIRFYRALSNNRGCAPWEQACSSLWVELTAEQKRQLDQGYLAAGAVTVRNTGVISLIPGNGVKIYSH